MTRPFSIFFCVGIGSFASWASASPASPSVAMTSSAPAAVALSSGAARVPFVENAGQADRQYAFTASTPAGSMGVTRRGDIVYAPRGERGTAAVTERLSSRLLHPRGAESAPTRVSYFVGADPARWKADIPTWNRVSLGQPWPGIELDLRARAGSVEKVFRLAPGADPEKIRIRVEGAGLRVDADGSLVVLGSGGSEGALRFTAPLAWEERAGDTRPVPVAYRVRGKSYGFELGPHDPAFPIVIDPLVQSTYFGGTNADQVLSLAFDPGTGDVYGTGLSYSTDLPGTAGSPQPAHAVDGNLGDAFVAHWNAGLTTLLQATYLGGGGNDFASSIVVYPGTGDVYIAGGSGSANLPQTAGAAHTSRNGGSDGFISRFDSTLTTLKRTTYIGGIILDDIRAMGVHPTTGEIYVVGHSSGALPETAGGAQTGAGSAFAARVSTDLSSIPQATYIGGGDAQATALAFDPSTGDLFVGGAIPDTSLPAHAGGAQPAPATGSGDDDGYVLRIHSTLAAGSFVQSTYFGGTGFEAVRAITYRASTAEVIVAGDTHSTDLPFRAGGAQGSKLGTAAVTDGFVVRLPASLTVAGQSSYVGGSGSSANAVALTSTGDVVVGGYTPGADLPGRAGGLQPAMVGSDDGFLSRLNGGLTSFVQSTYLGGTAQGEVILAIAISPTNGGLYAAGTTSAFDFPGTAGGANPTHSAGASQEGFVARLTIDLLPALRIAQPLKLDEVATAGTVSDLDKVFEANETAVVSPSWKNVDSSPIALTGTASALTGPAGAVYAIADNSASYGTVAPGGIGDCLLAGGDCYRMTITAATRPAAHWDATFIETLSDGTPKTWPLHLGDSFTDVPRATGIYRFVEKLFHNGVTSGCGGGNYCPGSSVTRAQMSVFLLVSKEGAAYTPPAAAGIFGDVPAGNAFAKWIEELFHRGVTAGCGGGNYCPSDPVTRAQMAVFLLVTKEGSAYTPPPATGIFLDVPASNGFAKWIEELVNRGITAGCGGGNYCPNSAATRGQMAVFLVTTFGLGF